jgi:predicted amidohydrolase
MIQMLVEGGRKRENLDHAEARIGEAAQAGAKVLLLPEAMTLGWTHPSAAEQAEPVPGGGTCERLSACASRWSVFICAGLIERQGQEVFNSAVLFGPAGALLGHHRKINELEIGHPFYALGDRLQAIKTPLATFGLMICADAFAPGQVLARSLALMGADVILSPCAWAVPGDHDNNREPYGQLWRDNYGPVARDFRVWIAGASNVGWLTAGPWSGWKCIGCSMLVGPDGEQRLIGPYGADADLILYADIHPESRPAQGDGWARFWGRL